MLNTKKVRREIWLMIFSFVISGFFVTGMFLLVFYQTSTMHDISVKIYNHPLKISNVALNLKSEVSKINENIKHIVFPYVQDNTQSLIKDILHQETNIHKNIVVVQKNILGDDGKELANQLKNLLDEWSEVRKQIITLVDEKKIAKAEQLLNTKNVQQVLKLEMLILKIYEHAQNKASNFIKKSDSAYHKFQFSQYIFVLTLIFVLSLITFYSVKRLSKYITQNEHMKGVLDVIKGVDQLIVREKNKEKLLQESCNILASKHVFSGAWIVILENDDKPGFICGTDNRSDFDLLKEKIYSGWTPSCIGKTLQNDNTYSFIEKTIENCKRCPLANLYGGQGAFNIALKREDKVFGYLTLTVDSKYIEYGDEIELLKQVAKDIAYALNNIDKENKIADIKELYANTIDSVENLIFVKDTDLNYIACNKAFEKFIGKKRDEIIGKTDYDIVDKETADFFRDHDIKMLASKQAKTNFEWVTYPDGKNIYLLTVKSPLINSKGEIIGLVGNSVDLTKQKKTEKQLLESEEKFKLLMKESPSVIEIYDLEGTQIEVNHAYEKLWQIPATSTLNKFNLFKSEEVKKSGLLEYIKRAYDGESVTVPVYEFDSRGPTEAQGKGRKRTLNTRIYPLKDSSGNIKNVVITHEDVTEKEKSLSQLEEKRKELEVIIKETPNPMILYSEDGKIITINKAWEDATGYTLEDTSDVYELIEIMYKEKDLVKSVTEHVKSLYKINSKIDDGEFTFENKNGQKLVWKFSSAPLGVLNGKRTVISSAMDITELKKKDEMIIAQSRHAAMGEMIGMIAHQWRQPLSVVSMIANNMLLDVSLGEFNAEGAEKSSKDILEQTQHLSKTIDDFRNFFKPEKDKSLVAVQSVVDETISIVKDSLKNNGIKYEVINNATSNVEAYQRELMQVFVNIITNSKDNFIANETENAFINITIDEDNKYVNTKICDNGGGINEAVMPKIFEPYFTTKDEKTGTGLGLYMSKMIIEEHLNGIIEASNTNDGVCFTVKLLKKGITENEQS